MIRRGLFFAVVIAISFFYLWIDFRGLSHADGIDQAQIAREVARGNGFVSKFIRPVALYQLNKKLATDGEEPAYFSGFLDTFHAPLNPLFNSLVLFLGKGSWEYDGESVIYGMDMLIAGASMVLLLCSIGISYLLISRVFDARIAGVTAFLLLFCELFWKFSQTGLPQMLMLFLFSFALYFLYKATENSEEGRSPYLWAALSGGFFGLLALANWLTIWMFVGLIIYVALKFRPRGVLAVVMCTVFAGIVSIWIIRNVNVSGDPAGAGRYLFYSGLGLQTESSVMRNADPENENLALEGVFSRTVNTSLGQLAGLYEYLGSIIVAPLFFLSLLHPFKRREIAGFRWCILLMWVFATIGMSLFGLDEGALDPNQIHILFIPIMTAYGLAFLSILWNRIELPPDIPVLRYGHFIIAIVASALPFLLTLPGDVKRGIYAKDFKMNYPPYHPPLYKSLSDTTKEHEVIVSDLPWAIAWYGDRMSIWLPKTVEQFDRLNTYAKDKGQPFSGILLSPLTTNAKLTSEILTGEYKEWAPLIVQGGISQAQKKEGGNFQDFPFPPVPPVQFLSYNQIIYYTDANRFKEK